MFRSWLVGIGKLRTIGINICRFALACQFATFGMSFVNFFHHHVVVAFVNDEFYALNNEHCNKEYHRHY